MRVYHGLDAFDPPSAGITLTIGNFDGVHRGHQSILAAGRVSAARLGTPLVVVTFEPHPLAILAPQRVLVRLTTLEEKLHLLGRYGADACIVLCSEPALLAQTAETFLQRVQRQCRPRAIVEGPDFHFGHGRAGTVQTLRDFAERLGFVVVVLEPARCADLPEAPAVSSSAIRAALGRGSVEAAAVLLGRPYRIAGTVVRGAGRGAQLGFPTANLDRMAHLLPAQAVYAAVAQLADGRLRLAAVNVGPQPTFGQAAVRVEAHVLDCSEPLVGQRFGLHFVARLREPRRFDTVPALAAQLQRDVAAARDQVAALRQLEREPQTPL